MRVGYLARYTRKIALSESRLTEVDDETASFRYQDYRDNQKKVMRLDGVEFIRRFLQHILPHGFMRIRHYGWLSNAGRAKQLPRVRAAIDVYAQRVMPEKTAAERSLPTEPPEPFQGIPCVHCKQGMMVVVGVLRPDKAVSGLMMS